MGIQQQRSRRPGGLLMLGWSIVAAGVIRLLVGVAAWLTIRRQLIAERIVVPGSGRLGGRRVAGPLSAFAEAEAIKRITLKATGGKAYGELAEDDPHAHMAMEGSLLRSSLFTSVLAFGVAAGEAAQGGLLVLVGGALCTVARRLPPPAG